MGSIFSKPKAPKAIKPKAPAPTIEEAKLQIGGLDTDLGKEGLLERLTIKRKKPTNTLKTDVGLGKIK